MLEWVRRPLFRLLLVMVLSIALLVVGLAGCSQRVVGCGCVGVLNVGRGHVLKVMEGQLGILK